MDWILSKHPSLQDSKTGSPHAYSGSTCRDSSWAPFYAGSCLSCGRVSSAHDLRASLDDGAPPNHAGCRSTDHDRAIRDVRRNIASSAKMVLFFIVSYLAHKRSIEDASPKTHMNEAVALIQRSHDSRNFIAIVPKGAGCEKLRS